MISKKDCENLLELQGEIQSEIEFLEGLFDEINKITDNPKDYTKKDMSEYLKNLLKDKNKA